MKKTLLSKTIALGLFMLFGIGMVNAQDLLNWTATTSISATQESNATYVTEGTYSAKCTFTSTSNQDINSDPIGVTEGDSFTFTLDVLDNDAAGKVRMAVAWVGSTNLIYSDIYSSDSPSFVASSLTGTVPTGATAAIVRLRFYDVSPWDGDATIWVDNVNFNVGGANLVVNGGFEDWDVPSTDEVDWYNLQWPGTGEISEGGVYDVYAQAYEAGVTDAAGQGAGLDVWIGVSTTDTDPSTWTTWIAAAYGEDKGNNDEYKAEIGSALSDGTYYYASKFQLNSGPFTYGGFDGGEWDGITNVSGVLTVNAVISTDATLSDLRYDGTTVTNFDAATLSYDVVLPYGTTVVPTVVGTPTDENATAVTTDASALPGASTVLVTAEDGATELTYTINFTLQATATAQVFITEIADPNNYLTDHSLTIRYIELYNASDVAIDFTENNGWRIDKYTNASATVSQTLNLTGTIQPKGFYIIATNVDNGSFLTTYGVSADQFDGAFDNVAGSNGDDNLELINGSNELVDQFGVPGEDGSDTNHEFEDGRAERVATVNQGNSIWDAEEWNIDSDAPSGDGPQDAPGAFDPREWIGVVALSTDATLSDLTVAGTTVAGFDAATFSYDVELPLGTTVVPTVVGTPTDANANAVTTDASGLPGASTVLVTAEDGTTELTYTINFTVAAALGTDASLSDLTVEGTTVAGFDAATFSYDVELGFGTTVVPTVVGTPTHANANAVTTDASGLPGASTVLVTAEDGTTELTYTINFTVAVALGTDASLSDLTVDGTTVAGFDAATFSYDIELGIGTTVVPTVVGIPTDANANAVTTDASGLPGASTVLVTAEDGTTELTYTINFTLAANLTIYDIQYTTDINGDSPLLGQTVTTTGIVSGVDAGSSYYIQDAVGAWNGIYVYDNANTVALGDEVTFTAEVDEFFNLTELKNISAFSIISSGNTVFAPVEISTLAANDEQYEGVLITVLNAECTNADAGNGMWELNDATGALLADDDIFPFTATLGTVYNVTGLGHFSFSEFKIIPREAADITVASGVGINDLSARPISIYPNPNTGKFFIETGDTYEANTKIEVFNVLGMKVFETLTNDFKTEINLSTMKQGIYYIRVSDGENIHTQKIMKQ